MPDISALVDETTELDIPIGNETLHVEYRIIGGFSSEEEEALSNASDAGDSPAVAFAIAELLCRQVVAWDLTYQGEPILLQPDVVHERVNTQLQRRIIVAINEDRDPKDQKAGANGRSRRGGTSSSAWKDQYRRANGRH